MRKNQSMILDNPQYIESVIGTSASKASSNLQSAQKSWGKHQRNLHGPPCSILVLHVFAKGDSWAVWLKESHPWSVLLTHIFFHWIYLRKLIEHFWLGSYILIMESLANMCNLSMPPSHIFPHLLEPHVPVVLAHSNFMWISMVERYFKWNSQAMKARFTLVEEKQATSWSYHLKKFYSIYLQCVVVL